jgi:hypothetical protein
MRWSYPTLIWFWSLYGIMNHFQRTYPHKFDSQPKRLCNETPSLCETRQLCTSGHCKIDGPNRLSISTKCTIPEWKKSDCGRLNASFHWKMPNASQCHYACNPSTREPSTWKSPNAANLENGCIPTCVMMSVTSPSLKMSTTILERMRCAKSVARQAIVSPQPPQFMTQCRIIHMTPSSPCSIISIPTPHGLLSPPRTYASCPRRLCPSGNRNGLTPIRATTSGCRAPLWVPSWEGSQKETPQNQAPRHF